MNITEKQMDLFSVDDKYYLAHCISSDYVLGKGIAVEFNNRYNMRRRLNNIGTHTFPDCIVIDNVFNLVTKKFYYNKPTYGNLFLTLCKMARYCKDNNIKYLAMSKIGCGLDRLQWDRVKTDIIEVFADMDIEILVCYK